MEGEFARPISRRVSRIYPQPNGGSPVIFSDADSTIIAAITHASVIDDSGIRSQLGTSSILDNVAGVKGDAMYRRSLNVDAYIKFKLNQNSNVRFFAGLSSTATNSVGSDNLGGLNAFGVGFSSAAGDSAFQFLHNDGGASPPGRVNTGVPWNNGMHELFMWTYKEGSGSKIRMQ